MGKQIGIIDETGYIAYEGQGFEPVTEEDANKIQAEDNKDEE